MTVLTGTVSIRGTTGITSEALGPFCRVRIRTARKKRRKGRLSPGGVTIAALNFRTFTNL